MKTPLPATILLVLAALTTNAAGAEASLYERIGGEAVMTRVVDDMVARMVLDPAVAATLEGIDLGRFSRKLYVHMCATTGGPCVYHGGDMKSAHDGMNITKAQLDVAGAALAAALKANGVGEREAAELARLRAPMRAEIVPR